MKKNIFKIIALLIFAITFNLQAQEDLLTKRGNELSRPYLRPSITRLFITDGSALALQASDSLKLVSDSKFDYNDIPQADFTLPTKVDIEKREERDSIVKAYMQKIITEKKIGNQIMHVWFPSDGKGGLSYENLMTRGQYAATDNDVLISEAGKRSSALNELGERLIDRSYIIAYLITQYDNKESQAYGVNVLPYIYKLDFNPEVQHTFYSEYYSESGIDSCNFPILYVMNPKKATTIWTETPHVLPSVKYIGYDHEDMMVEVGQKVADFQVKAPIMETGRIKANIGEKEGVRTDSRFSVVEYTMDEAGSVSTKKIGYVRASGHIAKNKEIADGKIKDMTRFIQYKGKRIRPGQVLVEDPDLGLNIVGEYSISEASVSFEYRLGKWIKFPGLLVYIKVGMPFNKSLTPMQIASINSDNEWSNFYVFSGSFGIAKEFNFARNFAVTPAVEVGVPVVFGAKQLRITEYGIEAKSTDTKSVTTLGAIKVGASVKLGFYATKNLQIFLSAGYNYYHKQDEFNLYQDLWKAFNDKDEAKDFNPISFGVGAKFGF